MPGVRISKTQIGLPCGVKNNLVKQQNYLPFITVITNVMNFVSSSSITCVIDLYLQGGVSRVEHIQNVGSC